MRLEHRSDDELMLLASAGVPSAFEAIVRRYSARVLRFAARSLSDASLAPDVAQRSFVALFEYRDRYRPCHKFWPYFSRIVWNQCQMSARAEKRYGGGVQLLQERDGDGWRARHWEYSCDLENAVARLSRKHRDVVTLRYAVDLDLEEIADVLLIPVGTVKSRLFTALGALREALGNNR